MVDFRCPNLPDSVECSLVSQRATERIRGIGGIDDNQSLGNTFGGLRNQAMLWILPMHDEATLHAAILGSADHFREQVGLRWPPLFRPIVIMKLLFDFLPIIAFFAVYQIYGATVSKDNAM